MGCAELLRSLWTMADNPGSIIFAPPTGKGPITKRGGGCYALAESVGIVVGSLTDTQFASHKICYVRPARPPERHRYSEAQPRHCRVPKVNRSQTTVKSTAICAPRRAEVDNVVVTAPNLRPATRHVTPDSRRCRLHHDSFAHRRIAIPDLFHDRLLTARTGILSRTDIAAPVPCHQNSRAPFAH